MLDQVISPKDDLRAPHVITVALSIIFVILSFLPYVAISLGSSTNVSVASMVGGVLTIRLFRQPQILIIFLVIWALPFTATLVRLSFAGGEININSHLTYGFIVFTFFGAASALDVLRVRCVGVLSACISSSAVIAIMQKYFFLDKGTVPFLELYNVSGYASVALNADTIAQYIRRPFGLFPEPSFLAGTLAMASGALVMLVARYRVPFRPSIATALLLAILTIYISDSGSGVVCIVLLGVAVFAPYVRRNKGLIFAMPVAVAVAAWLGVSIAASRQDGVNTSWNDRLASIIGGFNLAVADPLHFFVGVGRGMVPVHFRRGEIEFNGMPVYSLIPDIYSVLARLVLESGVLFGLPLIIWFFVLILRLGGSRMRLLGCLIGGLWLVVSGLTISYETAAWIWVLPGFCAAFSFLPLNKINSRSSKFSENTSRR